MKSVKRRFKNVVKRHFGWSTFMCFAKTVYAQKFQRKTILYWFNRLVSKDDYSRSEKKQLIDFLEHLSNVVEDRPKKA